MPFNEGQSIADRTPFTPAERAVLVERAETLKVELDGFIKQVKDGTSQEVIEALIPAVQAFHGVEVIVRSKLVRTIEDEYLSGCEEY